MRPEKELRKACGKIAKWHEGVVSIVLLPTGGFILKAHGDAEILPAIGIEGENLIGSQDDFDFFFDVIGYEAQVEKVNFNPTKMKFVKEVGWTSKYWKKSQPSDDFVVDTVGELFPHKISAIAIALIAAVTRESRHRMKRAVLGRFSRKSSS
jgi:hypothetical protein